MSKLASGTTFTEIAADKRMTPTEVSKLTGVDASTAWRWMLKGVRGHKLESVRVGARRFVTPAALETFLASLNAEESTPAPAASPSKRAAEFSAEAKRLGL